MKYSLVALLLLIFSNTVFANAKDISTQPIKFSQPINIAKDINALYTKALDESVPSNTRRSILCHQLPKLINDYAATGNQQTTKNMVGDLKENLKLTREHYKISCK